MGNVQIQQKGRLIVDDVKRYFPNDLPKFIDEGLISRSKFIKTHKGKFDGTEVLVKVYQLQTNDEDLDNVIMWLSHYWITLSPSKYPNLLPYQLWFKSKQPKCNNAYLMRQHIMTVMHDRLHARPFLSESEKAFIIYQMLRCIKDCHDKGIVHGDLKSENFLITSWNWLILTDFSPFKPVEIPADDPSYFKYYFDVMSRNKCYIAPERFIRDTSLHSNSNRQRMNSAGDNTRPNSNASNATVVSNTTTNTNNDSYLSVQVDNDDNIIISNDSNNYHSDNINQFPLLDGTRPISRPQSSQSIMSDISSRSPGSRLNSTRYSSPPGLTVEMDIFSLGCVIAEVLTGSAFLDLPSALAYLKSDAEHFQSDNAPAVPKELLKKIQNPTLRTMVWTMTHRSPNLRGTINQHLMRLESKSKERPPPKNLEKDSVIEIEINESLMGSSDGGIKNSGNDSNSIGDCNDIIFPYMKFYKLMEEIHWIGKSPDDRLRSVSTHYGLLMEAITGDIEAEKNTSDILSSFFDDVDGAIDASHRLIPHPDDDIKKNRYKLNKDSSLSNSSICSSNDNTEENKNLKQYISSIDIDSNMINKNITSLQDETEQLLAELNLDSNNDSGDDEGLEPLPVPPVSSISSSTSSSSSVTPPSPPQSETNDNNSDGKSNHDDIKLKADFYNLFDINVNNRNTSSDVPTFQGGNSSSNFITDSATTSNKSNRNDKTRSVSLDPLEQEQFLLHNNENDSRRRSMNNRKQCDAIVLLVQIIGSHIRHLQFPRSKVAALLMLVRLGFYAPDSIILRRILPFVVICLEDNVIIVRDTAIRSVNAILSAVTSISTFDSNMFQNYLSPKLSDMMGITESSKDKKNDIELSLKLTFVNHLGSLALHAKRFLELAHMKCQTDIIADITNSSSSSSSSSTTTTSGNSNDSKIIRTSTFSDHKEKVVINNSTYLIKLKQLQEQIFKWIQGVIDQADERPISLLSSHASIIKRAILHQVVPLFHVFGSELAMERLVTLIITFLSDHDWELRLTFCKILPELATLLGSANTCNFLVPCLTHGLLYDIEELVVQCTLEALIIFLQRSLLTLPIVNELCTAVYPIFLHPNGPIRNRAMEFVIEAYNVFESLDVQTMLIPTLKPIIKSGYNTMKGTKLTISDLKMMLISPYEPFEYRQILESSVNIQSYEKNESNILPIISDISINSRIFGTATNEEDKSKCRIDEFQNDENDVDTSHDISANNRKIFIDSYLELAAKELLQRTNAYKHQIKVYNSKNNSITSKMAARSTMNMRRNMRSIYHSRNNTVSNSTSSNNSTLNELLQVASAELPKHCTLYLPSQRVGIVRNDDLYNFSSNVNPLSITPTLTSSVTSTNNSNSNNNVNSSEIGNRTKIDGQKLNNQQQDTSTLSLKLKDVNVEAIIAVYGTLNSKQNMDSLYDLSTGTSAVVGATAATTAASMPTSRSANDTLLSSFVHDDSNINGDLTPSKSTNDNNVTNSDIINGKDEMDVLNTSTDTISATTTTTTSSNTTLNINQRNNRNNFQFNSNQNLYYNSSSGFQFSERDGTGVASLVGRNDIDTLTAVKTLDSQYSALKMQIYRKIKALHIPPLPPDMGSLNQPDGKKFNKYREALDLGADGVNQRLDWHPREGGLVCTLLEHTGAVNKLAVSLDHSFFLSCSNDRTVKVWKVGNNSSSSISNSSSLSNTSSAIHNNNHNNNNSNSNIFTQGFPESVFSFTGHKAKVVDCCILENTHSIASGGADGTVQIWRLNHTIKNNNHNSSRKYWNVMQKSVEENFSSFTESFSNYTFSNGYNSMNVNNNNNHNSSSNGSVTMMKKLSPSEGSIVSIHHFNTDMASVISYTSEYGFIHGWDLRAEEEAFLYKMRPELGKTTSFALGPDRLWMIVGTQKGYLGLWDIRFGILVKLWRHSSFQSIHRILTLKTLPKDIAGVIPTVNGAYVFIAASNNEAAIWAVPEGGICLKCFRSMNISYSGAKIPYQEELPFLIDINIPSHPNAPIKQAMMDTTIGFMMDDNSSNNNNNNSSIYMRQEQYEQQKRSQQQQQQQKLNSSSSISSSSSHSHHINAIIGQVRTEGTSFLITAGTDAHIRYWNLSNPVKSMTVSGHCSYMPKPIYTMMYQDDETMFNNNHYFDNTITTTDNKNKIENDNSTAKNGPNDTYNYKNNRMSRSNSYVTLASNHAVMKDRLTLCLDPVPNPLYEEFSVQSHLPGREGRGVQSADSHRADSILDLKLLELPSRFLLSSGYDGSIRIWK